MKKQSFLSDLISRISSDTPAFFVKLRNIGLYLAGVGLSLSVIPNVPALITTIAGYLITAGAVIGAVSTLPKKDANQL